MKKYQDALLHRIDTLCKEQNITYYTLSYRADVPLSTVMNIQNGTSKNPGIFTIMKICDGLGVSMKEFFDSEEFESARVESRDDK